MQSDLFPEDLPAPPPPPAPDPPPCCGLCVHRNAAEMEPEGDCMPVGRRRADDPVCDHFFRHHQLRASLYGRLGR